VVVGILFLEETHSEHKHRQDYGRDLGQWLIRHTKDTWYRTMLGARQARHVDVAEEGEKLIAKSLLFDEPPEYRTNDHSPSSSRSPSPAKAVKPPKPAATKAFTRQVILAIVSYGILAYHTMSFDQLMPVFLSSSPSDQPTKLPFKFTGGFSLSTKTVGLMLSVAGAYSMVAQLFLFPYIVKRFGALRTFQVTILTWPLLYFIVPYLSFLPPKLQVPGAFLCLLWRTTNQTLSYPSMAILLTNSAPSMLVLGLINGVAASCASLSRAFGPTVAGMIHSWALARGYVGISWWVSGLICIIGGIEAMFIQEPRGRMDVEPETEDEDEESSMPDPEILDAALQEAVDTTKNQ
jgi:hypothetical protein